MSQSKISSYFGTRKKQSSNNKIIKNVPNKKVNNEVELLKNVTAEYVDSQIIKAASPVPKSPVKPKKNVKAKSIPDKIKDKPQRKTKASTVKTRSTRSKTITDFVEAEVRQSSSPIPKLTSKQKKVPDTKSATVQELKDDTSKTKKIIVQPKIVKETKSITTNKPKKVDLNVTYTISKEDTTLELSDDTLQRTPKRNLPNPETGGSDSKKKKSESLKTADAPSFKTPEQSTTPITHSEVKSSARKNLFSKYQNEDLPKKKDETLPKKNNKLKVIPEVLKKANLISDERLELSKSNLAMTKFDKLHQKLQEFKSNKCKISSVITTANNNKGLDVEEKPIPSYIKYHSLAESYDGLALPFKYKLLSKTFECSDTVVNMLHNREEICTFNKLKQGVQDMTKRNFTETNLGQIKTVFPEAYNYRVDKNSAAVRNRNPGTPLYELVISPNLPEKFIDKLKSFQPMTPSLLIERKKTFMDCLYEIAKKHHEKFLERLNPPVKVPLNKINRWHPKFNVDNLPDIESSTLPELPNQPTVNTAKDILDKIRGVANENVIKKLESLTTQPKTESVSTSSDSKSTTTQKLLKKIGSDILERIRARESAKIIEDMTKSPENKKRTEMLERLPELIRIIRTYFITERKAAILLEDVIQKIMDSCHSLLSSACFSCHSLCFNNFNNEISLKNKLFWNYRRCAKSFTINCGHFPEVAFICKGFQRHLCKDR